METLILTLDVLFLIVSAILTAGNAIEYWELKEPDKKSIAIAWLVAFVMCLRCILTI